MYRYNYIIYIISRFQPGRKPLTSAVSWRVVWGLRTATSRKLRDWSHTQENHRDHIVFYISLKSFSNTHIKIFTEQKYIFWAWYTTARGSGPQLNCINFVKQVFFIFCFICNPFVYKSDPRRLRTTVARHPPSSRRKSARKSSRKSRKRNEKRRRAPVGSTCRRLSSRRRAAGTWSSCRCAARSTPSGSTRRAMQRICQSISRSELWWTRPTISTLTGIDFF